MDKGVGEVDETGMGEEVGKEIGDGVPLVISTGVCEDGFIG